jgi:ferredoxin
MITQGGATVEVSIDAASCQGHALCHMLNAAIFDFDDTAGKAFVTSPEVPPGQAEVVRKAEANCPERAIVITGGE